MRQCITCKYSQGDSWPFERLTCRRSAPRSVAVDTWPLVRVTDWCNEHEPGEVVQGLQLLGEWVKGERAAVVHTPDGLRAFGMVVGTASPDSGGANLTPPKFSPNHPGEKYYAQAMTANRSVVSGPFDTLEQAQMAAEDLVRCLPLPEARP